LDGPVSVRRAVHIASEPMSEDFSARDTCVVPLVERRRLIISGESLGELRALAIEGLLQDVLKLCKTYLLRLDRIRCNRAQGPGVADSRVRVRAVTYRAEAGDGRVHIGAEDRVSTAVTKPLHETCEALPQRRKYRGAVCVCGLNEAEGLEDDVSPV